MSRLLTTGILQQAKNNKGGFLLDIYPNAMQQHIHYGN